MNSGDLSEFNRLRRRLAIAVIALVVVTAVGVFGFALIGGAEHGLLDVLYMTVITLTTVGFGEIIDMSNSPAGRVFTLLLLLVGFVIVLYAVPMMTAFVIEGQLLNVFARRRSSTTCCAIRRTGSVSKRSRCRRVRARLARHWSLWESATWRERFWWRFVAPPRAATSSSLHLPRRWNRG